MAKKISEVAREALVQAREEGLNDDDAKWLAVGAVNAEARKVGVIGKELTPEMNAASQAVVKQELKHGKR